MLFDDPESSVPQRQASPPMLRANTEAELPAHTCVHIVLDVGLVVMADQTVLVLPILLHHSMDGSQNATDTDAPASFVGRRHACLRR